tara:strand:+ start:934 stop:1401 length:468 start_codon:yes stop_codon:yes gene_type:complete
MLRQIKKRKKFVDSNLNWKKEISKNNIRTHPVATTVHYQTFTEKVDWIEAFAKRKFSQYTMSLLKQEPNMLIPVHVDSYYFFKKTFKVNKKQKVYRANIFLEDWKPGHYFEVNNKPCVNWKAGQYILLDQTMWHRSGNVGVDKKYTAQVTGVLKV